MSKERDKFLLIKKDLNLSNRKIAEIMDSTTNSVEASTSERQYPMPKLWKLVFYVNEYYKNKYNE